MDNSFQQKLEPVKTKPSKGYHIGKLFSFILTVIIGVVLMMLKGFDTKGANINNMLAISALVGLLFIVTTWQYTIPPSEALFGGGGAAVITVTLSLFLTIAIGVLQNFDLSSILSSVSIEGFILLAALGGSFLMLYGSMCMIVSAIASLLSFFLKKAIIVYIHWTFNYGK